MPQDPNYCPALLATIQVLQAELNDLAAQKAVLEQTIMQKQNELMAKNIEYYTNCT